MSCCFLCQVVHSLHTRNDELEEQVQAQTSTYELEKQRLVAENMAKQMQCQEEKEKVLELVNKMEEAEISKQKLLQEQVRMNTLIQRNH